MVGKGKVRGPNLAFTWLPYVKDCPASPRQRPHDKYMRIIAAHADKYGTCGVLQVVDRIVGVKE